MEPLNIVIFGLSITSSWGNGHATTYRSLIKALHARGHQVTFFEKDQPWYAAERDMPPPPFCTMHLYQSVGELQRFAQHISSADLVIIGSYVDDCHALVDMVHRLEPACFAFYDIDTPVTLAALEQNQCGYLDKADVPRFDLYLSFTGGPTLARLETEFGAQAARALYCSVDADLYYPDETMEPVYELGYLGTYSKDRQPGLDRLMLQTATGLPDALFYVGGASYPETIGWPANVLRREHIPPHLHRQFYSCQKFTLNLTRADMVAAGYSPSVRLFEAAACATPIITDVWPGLDEFFNIGEEILLAHDSADVEHHLAMSSQDRLALGRRLRNTVMRRHTNHHRALELEQYWRASVPYYRQACAQ